MAIPQFKDERPNHTAEIFVVVTLPKKRKRSVTSIATDVWLYKWTYNPERGNGLDGLFRPPTAFACRSIEDAVSQIPISLKRIEPDDDHERQTIVGTWL